MGRPSIVRPPQCGFGVPKVHGPSSQYRCQRFDRAQVLRALRDTRRRLRRSETAAGVDQILALAIETVRALDIPHLESADDLVDGEVIH